MQCSAVQYSTVQYNAVICNVLYSRNSNLFITISFVAASKGGGGGVGGGEGEGRVANRLQILGVMETLSSKLSIMPLIVGHRKNNARLSQRFFWAFYAAMLQIRFVVIYAKAQKNQIVPKNAKK